MKKQALALLLAGISIIITGCQYGEKMLAPNTQGKMPASNSTFNGARLSSALGVTTSCNCAVNIQMHGKNPGKLKGNFSGTPTPFSVRIKGTLDINGVSTSGNWGSKEKYNSLSTTVEILDENENVVCECSYDELGQFVLPLTCDVGYGSPFLTFTPLDNGSLEVNLSLNSESQVVSYDLLRRGENDNAFTQIGVSIPYDAAANGSYTIIDPSPLTGFTLYLIRTNFSDCASEDSDASAYQS